MPMGRALLSDSGLVAIGATGLSGPLLYYAVPAGVSGYLAKVRFSCEISGTAIAVISNSNLYGSFNVVTGTKAGGAAVTPNPVGPDQTASGITVSSGSTAITGLTQSTEEWGGTIPFTPGSAITDDDPNTNLEVWLKPSTNFAFYLTVPSAQGFGAGMFARILAWHSE